MVMSHPRLRPERPAARAAITAVAHHVPDEVLDNAYFTARMDTTDEWIRTRTGIHERRVLRDGATSDLAAPAARRCLEARGIGPDDVDCIIVSTITPDHVFPSTAAIVQQKLGARRAWGFDLSAACSGFTYGLAVASSLVTSGAARRVLLCAADKMTALTNYEDRTTAVLFGDAGGAVLVEASEDPEVGLIDFECRVDGDGVGSLYMPAGGSARPASAETVAAREHFLVQDGATVFKAATTGMADVAEALMRRNGLTPDGIDWLVPHQANRRIIDAVGRRLGMPAEKVMLNVDRLGNTSAATIPTCLSEWHASGALAPRDHVVLASFGAGFSMAAVYLRWSVPQPAQAGARPEMLDAGAARALAVA